VLKDKGERIAAMIDAEGGWEAVQKEFALEAKTTELIARGASIPDVGTSEELDGVLFEMSEGASAGPVQVGERLVFVRLVDHQQADMEAFESDFDRLAQRELQWKQEALQGSWLADSLSRIDVYRYLEVEE
jgi:hypothetical protein